MAKSENKVNPFEALIKKVRAFYGDSLQKIIDLFFENGYEIRIAGESARDILLNKIPSSMSLVTTATTTQMKEMFAANQVKIVSSNLEKHGIVSPISNMKCLYQIASVQSVANDVKPQVVLTLKSKWDLYAYHRYFRLDSMYLDFDGIFYDCFNGFEDIMNSQVRFVGNPNARIKEDPLSILRYFRLFAVVASDVYNTEHDVSTLKAIKQHITALENVKGELVWAEVKAMLMEYMRIELLKTFIKCGGATCLGLPTNIDFDEFRTVDKCQSIKHPLLSISYLCTFLRTKEDVLKMHKRLKLSTYERDLAIFLVKFKGVTQNIDQLVYYQHLCFRNYGATRNISKEYVLELLKYNNKRHLFRKLLTWEFPSFPLDNAMLLSKGCRKGRTNEMMKKLEYIWISSNFRLSSVHLLKQLPVLCDGQ